jgi:ubiquinone/menaquinone biosynthesis C-methylase UbiE
VGIDVAKSVLEEAKKIVGQDADIEYGDVYGLQYESKSFDVVHAHQVLQHLQDPIKALKEMKRVSKGIVASREVDYESWFWYPHFEGMQKWKDCYRAVCRHNKADPDAGRKLKTWFIQAGFDPLSLKLAASTVMYSDRDRAKFISESWSKRVSETQLGEQMIKYGLATKQEIDQMATDWIQWGKQKDAVMFYVDVSVVGRA